ncbi:MAG TPA: radical SAM protein [Caldisericia bacterium]|nr:radical SAM protein [Caldisericia bacterium]HXK51935.1 radical SAM protein [Caldisericia bacterium]
MVVFGPVPSRRLGKSIGINHIPHKICTYSCAYCQIGHSLKMSIERTSFYNPTEIISELREKLKVLKANGEKIDYITFVPDGEPTLDKNLGELIRKTKEFEIPVAVITNSSLLSMEEVRNHLFEADWVSVKVDSVIEESWRKIDHPHRDLSLERILEGILMFAQMYEGILVSETMVVKELNDDQENAEATSSYLQKLQPAYCYISIPTRPPAESWVQPPDEDAINTIYQIFSSAGLRTELLIGYEGNEFAHSGNVADDILSITAVHPMREDAVLEYLQNVGESYSVIENLLRNNQLKVSEYNGRKFYNRTFGK